MTTLNERYEKQLAKHLQIEHAVAFGFSRHALMGILHAGGLKPGDEVILSPLTCAIVPLALMASNLKPVYADIDRTTLNLGLESLEQHVGARTKAIIFQHTYGHPGGVEKIARFSAQRKILLVEDAAQCLPVSSGQSTPGRFGDAAILSNNLRKPMPAGSGGVAVTMDDALAQQIRAYRDEFLPSGRFSAWTHQLEYLLHRYLLRPSTYWKLLALKKRLSTFYRQATVEQQIRSEITRRAYVPSRFQVRCGLKWLERIDVLAEHRVRRAREYEVALRNVDGISHPIALSGVPLYYYPILVSDKDDLLRTAQQRNVELIAWPVKLPIYPVEDSSELEELHYQLGSCPIAETVARELVGVQTDTSNRAADRDAVIRLLSEFFSRR